jgi:hypothetical protein
VTAIAVAWEVPVSRYLQRPRSECSSYRAIPYHADVKVTVFYNTGLLLGATGFLRA